MVTSPFIISIFCWPTQSHFKNCSTFLSAHLSALLALQDVEMLDEAEDEVVRLCEYDNVRVGRFLCSWFFSSVYVNIKYTKRCSIVTVTLSTRYVKWRRNLFEHKINVRYTTLEYLCYSCSPFSSNRTIWTVQCMVKSNSNIDYFLHHKCRLLNFALN